MRSSIITLKRRVIFGTLLFWSAVALFHIWLAVTNPYAAVNLVQQPYTTKVQQNQIVLTRHFKLKSFGNNSAGLLGYYKSGFLILQNTYFGSKPASSTSAPGIITDIHALRFDPTQPYLISGDSFSVLYPRNLGVFYNSILNPYTAFNQQDWENRQRIYLQSTAYALDAFAEQKKLTTTIVPIGQRDVLLTEVHPGSVPSDSLYGILFALQALQDPTYYPSPAPYQLQTVTAARKLTAEHRQDLRTLLQVYLAQVQDPSSGLVRADAKLASARDGATRRSSFYDTVILWKTLSLASELGVQYTSTESLDRLHDTILQKYWNETEGHFLDDLTPGPLDQNYSSDWLIALPTGFLQPGRQVDLQYLTRSVTFIRQHHLAEPFPIKYRAGQVANAPWAVRTFVSNYGGDAIWSYWGSEYIDLLSELGTATHQADYSAEATRHIFTYRQKMIETRGFPETFTAQGTFLHTVVYESICQTGWVVQFEDALWHSGVSMEQLQ
ncbi:MAG TPA: hypothetical protein VLF60_04585 [Candidatus Saccharimonadales bacterium]|nr:hypothetical protein [Candidatus Saccharimonadales bacterium]